MTALSTFPVGSRIVRIGRLTDYSQPRVSLTGGRGGESQRIVNSLAKVNALSTLQVGVARVTWDAGLATVAQKWAVNTP